MIPIDRIAWTVSAVSRALPSSLGSAFARLLSRYGDVSQLRIAVARDAAAFAGHVWLAYDGHGLVSSEKQGGFAGLLAWSSGKT